MAKSDREAPRPAQEREPFALRDALQALLGPAYRLDRELGGGGMSRVFVAHELALKRDVVVKVLPPDLATTASVARFTREVELTARLQHPHILPLIAAGGNERMLYYVAPFVRGQSLRHRLATDAPLPADEAVTIATELLSAVEFAHRNGVLHRDIKPANVLLSDGHAILADFGIAHALDVAEDAPSAPSATAGEVARPYAAPERARTEAADLYAVAAITVEMLTGQPPAVTPAPAVQASGLRAALRVAQPMCAAGRRSALTRVLVRALETNPLHRYETAGALRRALVRANESSLRPVSVPAVAGIVAAILISISAWTAFRGAAGGDPASPSTRAAVAPEAPPGSPATAAGDADASVVTPSEAVSGTAESVDGAASASPVRMRSARLELDSALAAVWAEEPALVEVGLSAATRALARPGELERDERALAEGLLALGGRRFPEACAAFERARAIRASFDAWFGLGECRRRDDLVIEGAGGEPTLRANYGAAVQAYENAIRVAGSAAPSVVYRRLVVLLPTEAGRAIPLVTTEGRRLLGEAVAVGDSLTWRVMGPGPRRTTPQDLTARARAVTVAQQLLRPILLGWTQQSPRLAAAHETLADLLERTGNIRTAAVDGSNALAEIRSARALPNDSISAIRLATSEVRLLLKAREYQRAQALADSVLRATRDIQPLAAHQLVGLAMITGQVDRAIVLLEASSGLSGQQVRNAVGQPVELPAVIWRQRAAFVVASALGVCTEAAQTAPIQLARSLEAMMPTAERPRGAAAAVLERPLLLAQDCVPPTTLAVVPEPSPRLLRAIRAHDPNRRASVAAELALVDARAVTTGFVSTEGTMVDALTRLAVGDSSGARVVLARGVDAFPLAPSVALTNEVLAGTYVRSMALLALLDAAAGEHTQARTLATAVLTLWRGADAELQPTIAQLRGIAGGTN